MMDRPTDRPTDDKSLFDESSSSATHTKVDLLFEILSICGDSYIQYNQEPKNYLLSIFCSKTHHLSFFPSFLYYCTVSSRYILWIKITARVILSVWGLEKKKEKTRKIQMILSDFIILLCVYLIIVCRLVGACADRNIAIEKEKKRKHSVVLAFWRFVVHRAHHRWNSRDDSMLDCFFGFFSDLVRPNQTASS